MKREEKLKKNRALIAEHRQEKDRLTKELETVKVEMRKRQMIAEKQEEYFNKIHWGCKKKREKG